MSQPGGGSAGDPLQVLLERVERDREERCREILQGARSEAEAMRAQAYAQARRRLHQAVRDERQRLREQLESARATQETRQRQAYHEQSNTALAKAWELLEQALENRWRTPEGRREWLVGALEQAERFLPPGTWTIAHPPELASDELPTDLDTTLGPDQVTLATEADPALNAGIRIRCGGAELDATPAGLLADPKRVRSWLLATLAAHRSEKTG